MSAMGMFRQLSSDNAPRKKVEAKARRSEAALPMTLERGYNFACQEGVRRR